MTYKVACTRLRNRVQSIKNGKKIYTIRKMITNSAISFPIPMAHWNHFKPAHLPKYMKFMFEIKKDHAISFLMFTTASGLILCLSLPISFFFVRVSLCMLVCLPAHVSVYLSILDGEFCVSVCVCLCLVAFMRVSVSVGLRLSVFFCIYVYIMHYFLLLFVRFFSLFMYLFRIPFCVLFC